MKPLYLLKRFPAKAVIAKYLAELNADGATNTYVGLAREFGFDTGSLMDPRTPLYQILQSIQKSDMDADRPARTVAVNGLNTGIPGNGYFRLYGIGKDEDRKAITTLHRAKAKAYYSQLLYCDQCHPGRTETPHPKIHNTVYLPHPAEDYGHIGGGRILN